MILQIENITITFAESHVKWQELEIFQSLLNLAILIPRQQGSF